MRNLPTARIHAIVLLAACLAGCSGIALLTVARFEPENAEQAAYAWTANGRDLVLTTPEHGLRLYDCAYFWTGSASSGGTFSVHFQLEGHLPEGHERVVVSAAISPIRVSNSSNVGTKDEYPLQVEEVFWTEYSAFRRALRQTDRSPREVQFVPENTTINTYEGVLSTRIPFRPRRVRLTLQILDAATQETETLSFIVRGGGLRARL